MSLTEIKDGLVLRFCNDKQGYDVSGEITHYSFMLTPRDKKSKLPCISLRYFGFFGDPHCVWNLRLVKKEIEESCYPVFIYKKYAILNVKKTFSKVCRKLRNKYKVKTEKEATSSHAGIYDVDKLTYEKQEDLACYLFSSCVHIGFFRRRQ